MRDLKLGERIAIHSPQQGICVGLVTSITAPHRAVIFLSGGRGLESALPDTHRVATWCLLSPGQWCSIEDLHRSIF